MEFSEKLQKLRKSRNLTQEQLAKQLFVSRTAISKWESDRGYPNIDSLKAISEFFSVSIDDLLSSDELIEVCEHENSSKIAHIKSHVFAILDIMIFLLLFLPVFKEKSDKEFLSVTIFSVTGISEYMKIIYIILICLCGVYGILHLLYTILNGEKHLKLLKVISISLTIILILLFSGQAPYAVVYVMFIMIFKGFLLINKIWYEAYQLKNFRCYELYRIVTERFLYIYYSRSMIRTG